MGANLRLRGGRGNQNRRFSFKCARWSSLEKENSSYQQILDQYRERKARALLKENRVSVKEIAWQLGFANQSAFTRAFKRWTGQTPRQFQS